jgi:hypothetical protein
LSSIVFSCPALEERAKAATASLGRREREEDVVGGARRERAASMGGARPREEAEVDELLAGVIQNM